MIHYIEGSQINDEVIKHQNQLVVINFYATWSMPCEEFSHIMTVVEKKYSGEIDFYKVNIEEANDISIRYNIQATPTTLFFKDGQEVERAIGLIGEDRLISLLEELK